MIGRIKGNSVNRNKVKINWANNNAVYHVKYIVVTNGVVWNEMENAKDMYTRKVFYVHRLLRERKNSLILSEKFSLKNLAKCRECENNYFD